MQQLVEDEREHAAAELISALPEDSREVLLLFYREGQSSQQVALLLGMSDAAVRKRLSRARASLREDLLARFGEFAAGSAPGLAFTSVIATALTIASPPAAAKGILTIAAAGGAKTLGKIVFGAAGSIGFALIGAFGGIWLGLRKQLKGAIDEEERRGLIRSATINGIASVLFMVCAIALARYDDGWVLPVLAMLAFMAVIFHQTIVVQPRVLARRHAREAQRDPPLAAKIRRRERIQCWLGATIGFVCGFGGMIAGLVASGRF